MRILRWLGAALGLAVALVAVTALAARLSDGPIGPFAGGPLASGEWVDEAPADWSFAAPVREIELQLLAPPRSRTTWIVVAGGRAYVPCAFPDIRLWKQWPHEALRDGRAVARIEGRRYPVTLVRESDPVLREALDRRVAEKYPIIEAEDPGEVWFFRLDFRPR